MKTIYKVDNKTINEAIFMALSMIIFNCFLMIISIYTIFFSVLYIPFIVFDFFFTYKKLQIDEEKYLLFSNRYFMHKSVKYDLNDLRCVAIYRYSYIRFVFNSKTIRMLINKKTLSELKNELKQAEETILNEEDKIIWKGNFNIFLNK